MRVSTIRVGARVYDVQRVGLGTLADDGRQADICHRTAVIRLPDEGSPQQLAHLLLHESLHALFDDTGLDLPREEEERLVSVLTPRLTALFRDNPEQIRELLKALR